MLTTALNKERTLLKYIISFLTLGHFSFAINQNLNGMATFFQHYFAGTNNLRIISIILLLLAFILFLFLIVILYIKSLLSFIKESEETLASKGISLSSNAKIEDQEMEKELEKEFERDMEANKGQRESLSKKQNKQNLLDSAIELGKKKKQEIKPKTQPLRQIKENIPYPSPIEVPGFRGNASLKEFDWSTGRQGELDELAAGINSVSSQYPARPLIQTTGLIINMLGRNIDAGKIAQTVKNRCQNMASEEEIIQTIDAIQNFISLANNGKFSALPNGEDLPSPDEALLALSRGDTGLSLSLMEALINYYVDKGSQANIPQKRDIIFLEAANYACIFGSIAQIDGDAELATSAFELAIELSPKNANAWSRVGDSYEKSNTDSKAVWAYQNVLTYADTNLYPHQIANANQKLAKYYESQGDRQRAASLYNLSNSYYNTIGINTHLTNKELDIVSIIESKQEENMPDTIQKLLNYSKMKQSRQM